MLENRGNVKTEMEIDVIINEKDNTTTKINTNINKLIIITPTTRIFNM